MGHFRNSPGDVRLREVATKNRAHYRRLRKELEDLTDHGLRMLKSLQRPEANIMQRLAVQLLCKQLDQAWTYFNRYVIMYLLIMNLFLYSKNMQKSANRIITRIIDDRARNRKKYFEIVPF